MEELARDGQVLDTFEKDFPSVSEFECGMRRGSRAALISGG